MSLRPTLRSLTVPVLGLVLSGAKPRRETVHVTRVEPGREGAYGHPTSRCDAGGCAAGTELYYADIDAAGPIEAGRVYSLDEHGVAISEVRS